jgi:hypothetical protein
LLEGLVDREAEGKWEENADPKDFPRRLRVGSERRQEDGEGQHRNEPNGVESHDDLLTSTRIAPDLVPPNAQA